MFTAFCVLLVIFSITALIAMPGYLIFVLVLWWDGKQLQNKQNTINKPTNVSWFKLLNVNIPRRHK